MVKERHTVMSNNYTYKNLSGLKWFTSVNKLYV